MYQGKISTIVLSFIFLFLSFESFADDYSCQSRRDIIGECQSVNGILNLRDGTPSARITIEHTKRLLGVALYYENNHETFAAPEEIRKRVDFDHPLNGTFIICPLSKKQPGQMQSVCIEASDITTTDELKCPNHRGEETVVRVFDGAPEENVNLEPDSNAVWEVGYIYDQGRNVFLACQDKANPQVMKIDHKVQRCFYKIDHKKNVTISCH